MNSSNNRRISHPGDINPLISYESVLNFFERRAEKVKSLGPARAVIYQDKNLNFAERRDAAEKTLLFPLMCIGSEDRVLDAGCGTGRWAELLVPQCAYYHGIDVSPGLIRVVKERFGKATNAEFSVCTLDELSQEAIGVSHLFSRVISLGVFIYLNDKEVLLALNRMAMIAEPHARIIFREPVGINYRLTLNEQYSDDMDQYYSAIYRTETELLAMFDTNLVVNGFQMVHCGDVYEAQALNNRTETKQRFFVFQR